MQAAAPATVTQVSPILERHQRQQQRKVQHASVTAIRHPRSMSPRELG
eukprot:CAMPEP_0172830098 /NCGR_PEP_ID=MMETSP1075-20121228/21999_1 /TAXON_ID=2916 /ORGANISM="Ceratium fusus, Strain PA161109" /LENGTH=47 /DNA_ID= /DNA_START= /DNA_END= /DNA_ORIENTATION=